MCAISSGPIASSGNMVCPVSAWTSTRPLGTTLSPTTGGSDVSVPHPSGLGSGTHIFGNAFLKLTVDHRHEEVGVSCLGSCRSNKRCQTKTKSALEVTTGDNRTAEHDDKSACRIRALRAR